MSNSNIKETDILIGKFLSGNATSQEIKQLKDWKEASKTNQKIYKKAVEAWDKSDNWISCKIIEQDKFKVKQENNNQQSISLRKYKRLSTIYKIAAILAIPLALSLSWYLSSSPSKNYVPKEQLCEITAPKGHISKCILPDGTQVWINTCSSISYNTSEFNQNIREVKLEGEAFFEVAKNKKIPFVVNSTIANINVTGTSFNVKAYAGADIFETVLVEGAVELQFKKAGKHLLQLRPGERALLDINEREIKIENVDTELYSSWINGEIIFKDATLNDLITELERIYDINFTMVDKGIGNFRFRGMFSYNNNLIDALEKIKQTAGIDYYIENKEVKLSMKNTN